MITIQSEWTRYIHNIKGSDLVKVIPGKFNALIRIITLAIITISGKNR